MVHTAQQTLRRLDGVSLRSPPLCPVSPSPPWCSFMAGIWKRFLFTQRHQDAAARCAPANGNLGFPAGPFQRPHAKQPAVLQGTSGPCYISAGGKRYHLCKQVILVCLPVLWTGSGSQTLRQTLCCRFVFSCLSAQGFLSVPSPNPCQ